VGRRHLHPCHSSGGSTYSRPEVEPRRKESARTPRQPLKARHEPADPGRQLGAAGVGEAGPARVGRLTDADPRRAVAEQATWSRYLSRVPWSAIASQRLPSWVYVTPVRAC
jgi:hypothetical protein